MRVVFTIIYFLSLVYVSWELRPRCTTHRIQNGKVRLRHRYRIAIYTCNVGYILVGDSVSSCFRGKWDSPPPKCVRTGCRKVGPLLNGMIHQSYPNAVMTFVCNYGMELRGRNETYCNGTSWSTNTMPTCLPTDKKPKLSCDFEAPDLCGWSHDLNHDFDWRRMQFNTPSGTIGTGPLFDHTFGKNKGGYYMYIESTARNENDTARLISPVYYKTENDTCFEFFYHMYGTTIGSLRVYLKMVNETWDLDPSKAFFDKHGNQGDQWLGHIQLFGPIENDYQIIIEGVRGNGYVSDIAIDDVKIIENCNIDEIQAFEMSTTTEMEGYGTTDFLPDDLFSCEDRCFSIEITVGKHRKCSCDENCFDRNECCPDFIDFCIVHGVTSTDSEYTSSTVLMTTPTTTKKTAKTTTTSSTTPKSSTTTAKVTTQTMIEEKKETTTTQTTHIPIIFTLHYYPKPKVITKKTTTERLQTTKSTTQDKPNEIQTEPNARTTYISIDIPRIPEDMVPIEDVAHLKRKYNEKIIIYERKEGNNTILYLILCGFGIVLGVAIAMFLRRNRFRSRGFRSASHGDSASDVRFLTNDELLDLNLDYE